MLLAGLWRLMRGPDLQTETASAVPDRDAGARSNLLITVALLFGFALLVPVLGFAPTCFMFLAVLLRVLGGWTWWLSLGVAAPIALAFHVVFIQFADMPLPKGYFGI